MRNSQTLQGTQVVAAVVSTAAIFAVDLSVAPGFAVGVLYVVPLLLGAFASPLHNEVTAAWVASTLIVAGLVVKGLFAPIPATAFVNRGIALVIVWTTAVVVARLLRTTERLETQTRDLADTNYALDQSAIVATTNTKGTITFVNDKFCEISRYRRDELLGQDHRILNSGYHPKEFIRTLWTTIANGRIWRGDIRNRAKDGSIYWVDTTIVPFLDDRGKPYQYMAIRYEITARKQSETLLIDATGDLERRTRDLADMKYALDQSAIVATTNTKGTITFVNDKFCEISKYSREELLGQDHRILNSGYHPKEFIRTLWTTIANGHIWRGEIRNRTKDGSIYWVDTTIVPFLDAHGKPYQYMAIRYEITERKRQEELLREQAALTRLGEMAAVVAHEVKNPIAGIRGALQVIVGRMPADQRDRSIIGDIIARLDALNGIVQDLLLFARPRQVKREPVDLRSLTGNIVEMLKRDPALATLDVRISGSPAPLSADPEQLRIVLQNLLMNAAQAMGGHGVIEVSLSADNGGSQVSVRDHGPGMPTEVREKAFNAFFTTKHRGTGLGLPIARRVIEAHGGEIDIATPDGGGTVVSVRLPKSEG
jgi:PAS domain S-box-containing protein